MVGEGHCTCCINGQQRLIIWPSLTEAFSPAVRWADKSKSPVWLWESERDRLHQTIPLMSSLTFTAQQGPAVHAPRSVVCFHTKPCVCHLRYVVPWGGSRAAVPGLAVWPEQYCLPPECRLLYILPWSKWNVSWDAYERKDWRELTDISVRTCVFEPLSQSNTRSYVFDIFRWAWVYLKSLKWRCCRFLFVTYFTIMRTVVFLLDSILLPLKACGIPQGSILCPLWFLNYSQCFL